MSLRSRVRNWIKVFDALKLFRFDRDLLVLSVDSSAFSRVEYRMVGRLNGNSGSCLDGWMPFNLSTGIQTFTGMIKAVQDTVLDAQP